MGFSESSLLSKIALGVSIAAFIFNIIGFPSNDWLAVNTVLGTSSLGLFKQCILSVCVDLTVSPAFDWWKAVQAMEIIGFLCGLACLVLVIIFVVVKSGSKMLHLAALATALAAALFIIIGCIIFGAKYEDNVGLKLYKIGWSFALTILGGILYLAAGVILLVDKMK